MLSTELDTQVAVMRNTSILRVSSLRFPVVVMLETGFNSCLYSEGLENGSSWWPHNVFAAYLRGK